MLAGLAVAAAAEGFEHGVEAALEVLLAVVERNGQHLPVDLQQRGRRALDDAAEGHVAAPDALLMHQHQLPRLAERELELGVQVQRLVVRRAVTVEQKVLRADGEVRLVRSRK